MANDTLSALELGRRIADGKSDPRDVVRAAIVRIKAEDADHAIFVRLLEARALAEADAAYARAKSGLLRSALDGVPVAWKDNIDVAGAPTEAGSPLLKGRMPPYDAPAVAAAAAAGTVNFGKTNMTELAFSGIGYNPYTGTPRNAFDDKIARLPGGSSAGSGVAVARGLAPIAVGTDTGGSVRVPAAWNNLVGLKTTAGRLSLNGLVRLSPSLDTIGPLARDVADAAALYEILAADSPIDLDVAAPGDLHLIALEGTMLDDVEPETREAIARAIDLVRRAGFDITARKLSSVEQVAGVPGPAGAEAYALWGGQIEAAPGKVFRLIEERVLAAKTITASVYLALNARLAELGRRFVRETAGFDAVLMPTVAMRAPPIAAVEASAEAYRVINLRSLSLPSLANRLGLCAITLPAGFAGAPALPVGLTLLGRPWAERRLLQIAKTLERSLAV